MAIEQAALQQTIAALHALAQSPAGSAVTGTLSEAELASAAGRLGLSQTELFTAIRAAGRTAVSMNASTEAVQAGRVWKAISTLARSPSATAAFSETVSGVAGGSGLLAIPTATAALTAALGALLIGGVVIGGAWMWQRSNDPEGLSPTEKVLGGDAESKRREREEMSGSQSGGSSAWVVVQLKTGPRTIKVTSINQIPTLRFKDFLHAGLSTEFVGDKGVTIISETAHANGFSSREAAWEWVCGQVKNVRPVKLAAGWTAEYGGSTVSIENSCHP